MQTQGKIYLKQIKSLMGFVLAGWMLVAGCAGAKEVVPTVQVTSTAQETRTAEPSMTKSAVPLKTMTAVPSKTVTQTPLPETADCGKVGQHACISVFGKPNQGERIRYLLYLPESYGEDPGKKWPLILFLHGSGEAGRNLDLLRRVPLPGMLEGKTDFPFIVVSPQIPAPEADAVTQQQSMSDPHQFVEVWGWNGWIERLNLLMTSIEGSFAIDTGREYLTGLSLGGFGVWNYASRYPQRFAAIVPIAGGYEFGLKTLPANLCKLQHLPVWAFHGGEDMNVKPWQSQILVDALAVCGGNARLTVYPDVGHKAWETAYADPNLWEWLLEQKK